MQDTDCRIRIAGHRFGHGLQDMDTDMDTDMEADMDADTDTETDMDSDMDCRTWTRTWTQIRRHWIQYKYFIFSQESVQLNEFIIFRQDSVRC